MVHQYACSMCAFQIRSEDDDEVITLVREHAKGTHDANLSRGDVRDGWEEVQVEAMD